MKFSVVPIFVVFVFSFCVFLTYRAQKNGAIVRSEARNVYFLFFVLFVWTLISAGFSIKGGEMSSVFHESIPFLWQACVPVVIVVFALLFSSSLRSAMRCIASGTPAHWFVFFQVLRVGALGGVVKGINGEITSSFVFWVGIPDFLFGVSAVIVGWLVVQEVVGNKFLMFWNLIGAAIILVPTFLFSSYFMNEPGMSFIFEFPMVLAPSIVVPIFVLLNFLQAGRAFELLKGGSRLGGF